MTTIRHKAKWFKRKWYDTKWFLLFAAILMTVTGILLQPFAMEDYVLMEEVPTSGTTTTTTMDKQKSLSQSSINATVTTSHKPWKYFPWSLGSSNNTISKEQQSRWCVMVISMGQQAERFRIVERIWLSLRRRGDFFGPMLVLTDAATPERYLGIQQADPNFFPIHPNPQDYNWDSAFVDEAMPYKRFKTYLLDYLDKSSQPELDQVEYVLYLDADVVTGSSLKGWLDFCEGEFMRSDSKSSMIFFEGNFDDMPIQSGQFAMQRSRARGCLEQWRQAIDENPKWDKDQYSLKSLHEKKTSICNMRIIPQDPWLQFVKKTNLDQVVGRKSYKPIMHIQNTGHARYMREHSVQKLFRDLLRLTPEEAVLNWKTPMRASREWSMGQVKETETK